MAKEGRTVPISAVQVQEIERTLTEAVAAHLAT